MEKDKRIDFSIYAGLPIEAQNQARIDATWLADKMHDAAMAILQNAVKLDVDTHGRLSLSDLHACYDDDLKRQVSSLLEQEDIEESSDIGCICRTRAHNVLGLGLSFLREPASSPSFLVMDGMFRKSEDEFVHIPIGATQIRRQTTHWIEDRILDLLWHDNRPYLPMAWLCDCTDRMLKQNLDVAHISMLESKQQPVWELPQLADVLEILRDIEIQKFSNA